MSTFLTYAPSCSPGTRTSSVANAPAGIVLGCRLMCASAPAGAISAPASSSSASLLACDMFVFLLVDSLDRDANRAAVLFEFGDAVDDFDLPRAAGAEHGGAEDVVAGPGGMHGERQRADALGGQPRGGGQFLGGGELG